MVLTQVPPVEHFFDGLTRWFGQEGGDLDMITMTGWDLFMEPSVYVTRTKGPKPYYVLHPNNRLRTLLSYQGTALRLRAIGWMGALAPAP